MHDTITIIGYVATPPKHLIAASNLPITSFRLASDQGYFDRTKKSWVDTDTNWYTVSAFRRLATNAANSLHKGDRVIVTGKLRIRSWENGEKRGTNVEIDADVIGHDLGRGTAVFTLSTSDAAQVADEPPATAGPAAGGEPTASTGEWREDDSPGSGTENWAEAEAEPVSTPF